MNQEFRDIISSSNVVLKKRLGQHFMLNTRLLESLAQEMVPDDSCVALEIGSGIGTLTRALCRVASHVVAVEKDHTLTEAAGKVCAGISNLTWVWGDALEQDLTGASLHELFKGAPLVLCGNLPYYISSEVLYRALVPRSKWRRLAFVVQKELGQRMAAPAGTHEFGRLSLWCQYRGKVRMVRTISKSAFLPPPDVNSCLVVIEMNAEFPLDENQEQVLDQLSRAAFSQRRKSFRKACADLAHDVAPEEVMAAAGIDPGARPEHVSVEQWISVVRMITSR